MSTPSVLVHPDVQALTDAVATRFVARVVDAQGNDGVAQVVLTGGRVATAMYRAVAASPDRDAIDWSRVELWWGDERFLPAGDADRNETQARAALLAAVGLDPARVHPMPADSGQGAARAAADYAAALAAAAGPGDAVPVFDLLLLGVGPDGHVASLFPGHPALREEDATAVAVHDAPKPPPTRVSLTMPVLSRAAEVWFVVSGEDKAAAVQDVLSGGRDLPAAGPRGRSRTVWLLDEAAAGEVPGDRRDA